MAIFDADKEGFLRSERSLIQTIGRAARNVRGRAILYADARTGSMDRAIGETNRRRAKQLAHNQAQGIVPVSISKTINDVMEGARVTSGGSKRSTKTGISRQETTEIPQSPKALGKLLAELEKRMLDHAQNLEFEEAAAVRDQLQRVRDAGLKH